LDFNYIIPMINKLKDISTATPIAGLPAIFNANN
jgi:hypothetical protein